MRTLDRVKYLLKILFNGFPQTLCLKKLSETYACVSDKDLGNVLI